MRWPFERWGSRAGMRRWRSWPPCRGRGLASGDEALPALWRPFFANAVVQLGRAPSPAPVALYYNPLLDVAVTTLWEKQDGGYRVVWARALPGERLADPEAAVVPLPS